MGRNDCPIGRIWTGHGYFAVTSGDEARASAQRREQSEPCGQKKNPGGAQQRSALLFQPRRPT